jgi:hypothetical protein
VVAVGKQLSRSRAKRDKLTNKLAPGLIEKGSAAAKLAFDRPGWNPIPLKIEHSPKHGLAPVPEDFELSLELLSLKMG